MNNNERLHELRNSTKNLRLRAGFYAGVAIFGGLGTIVNHNEPDLLFLINTAGSSISGGISLSSSLKALGVSQEAAQLSAVLATHEQNIEPQNPITEIE